MAKSNEKKDEKPPQLKLPGERICSFFAADITPAQMEAEIYEALLAYRQKKETQD